MKRSKQRIVIQDKTKKFPPYEQWFPEIQNTIIDFCTHYTTAQKPKEAASTIKALAVTNKKLNKLINSPDFNNKLIHNLTFKFYCSHETIIKYLKTKQAKKQLNLQYDLKELCYRHHNDPQEKLNNLINKKVNLNFTYNRYGYAVTPLMLCTIFFNNDMFNYLQQYTNINETNSTGFTALHLAAQWPINKKTIDLILQQPKVNINQQNKSGRSPLLYCLTNRYYANKKHHALVSWQFIANIQRLLIAGADPELADKKGLTPLQAAQKLRNNEVIHLIQAAIAAKNR